jgi:hypothetical protein
MIQLDQQVSFTISEFCARNRISVATFYKPKKVNAAPRTMTVLNAIRITADAEREWQRAREAEAAELAGSVEEARRIAHMSDLGKRSAASPNFVQRQREEQRKARRR